MVLINCEKCGAKAPPEAVACPQCGHPINPSWRWFGPQSPLARLLTLSSCPVWLRWLGAVGGVIVLVLSIIVRCEDLNFKDEKADGLYTSWYENGQKESEGNRKDGKQDGLWRFWFSTGQKEQEGTFKDGKLVGLWTFWFSTGQKWSEKTYKDDKANGLGTAWYKNGQKKKQGTYKDGWPHGPVTEWYENGQKSAEETFEDGYLVTATVWKPNGEKCPGTNLVNGNGIVCYYHKNGQKKGESNRRDGKLDGLYTSWYENGQKKEESNWRDDKLMSAEVWKPNGEKCPVTNVKDGDGVGVRYNEDGTEKARYTYKDGELVKD